MKKTAKNLFIPHEGNGYKPHILQKVAVGVMFLMILISFTFANLQAVLWMGSDWLVSTILPAVIVEETNDERATENLITLNRNATLDTAAQLKADHMAEYGYFAHHAPDGTSPWYFFDTAGYPFVHAGENLAVHFTDSEEVVEAWMDSPGHRANILNGDYREIGIGVARGEYQGFDTIFVVQLFGTPAVPVVASVQETTPQPETITVEVETTNDATSESVSPATVATEPVVEETPDVIIERQDESVPVTIAQADPVPEPAFTDVSVTPDDTVVMQSELTTSNSNAVEAPVVTENTGGTTPGIARTATQPQLVLQFMYLTLALFVVVALTLSIAIEWRRQHPVQIAYGGGLLATMALLMWVHTALVSGVLIV